MGTLFHRGRRLASKKKIDRRKQGEILNRDLQSYALTNGYLFVDPWAADRQLSGGWPSDRTIDGAHPTVAMSKKARATRRRAHCTETAASTPPSPAPMVFVIQSLVWHARPITGTTAWTTSTRTENALAPTAVRRASQTPSRARSARPA